jgi:hypothetical protein
MSKIPKGCASFRRLPRYSEKPMVNHIVFSSRLAYNENYQQRIKKVLSE